MAWPCRWPVRVLRNCKPSHAALADAKQMLPNQIWMHPREGLAGEVPCCHLSSTILFVAPNRRWQNLRLDHVAFILRPRG
jgi:hypothetical protein